MSGLISSTFTRILWFFLSCLRSEELPFVSSCIKRWFQCPRNHKVFSHTCEFTSVWPYLWSDLEWLSWSHSRLSCSWLFRKAIWIRLRKSSSSSWWKFMILAWAYVIFSFENISSFNLSKLGIAVGMSQSTCFQNGSSDESANSHRDVPKADSDHCWLTFAPLTCSPDTVAFSS